MLDLPRALSLRWEASPLSVLARGLPFSSWLVFWAPQPSLAPPPAHLSQPCICCRVLSGFPDLVPTAVVT